MPKMCCQEHSSLSGSISHAVSYASKTLNIDDTTHCISSQQQFELMSDNIDHILMTVTEAFRGIFHRRHSIKQIRTN